MNRTRHTNTISHPQCREACRLEARYQRFDIRQRPFPYGGRLDLGSGRGLWEGRSNSVRRWIRKGFFRVLEGSAITNGVQPTTRYRTKEDRESHSYNPMAFSRSRDMAEQEGRPNTVRRWVRSVAEETREDASPKKWMIAMDMRLKGDAARWAE